MHNSASLKRIIYTEITRNQQKLRILIKEITYICYGIFRPKLIAITPANFIIYNLLLIFTNADFTILYNLILKTSEIYLLK